MDGRPLRILIASDGSPSAERAIALAGSVTRPAGTELRLITVIASVPVLVASMLIPEMPTTPTEVERQLRSLGGRDIEVIVREGRAASRIIDEAADWQADLVILGSHGYGPLRSALLGSVAAEVVDHAPCAVLVARRGRADHALLADDGSETATTAAAFLARIPSLGAPRAQDPECRARPGAARQRHRAAPAGARAARARRDGDCRPRAARAAGRDAREIVRTNERHGRA